MELSKARSMVQLIMTMVHASVQQREAKELQPLQGIGRSSKQAPRQRYNVQGFCFAGQSAIAID